MFYGHAKVKNLTETSGETSSRAAGKLTALAGRRKLTAPADCDINAAAKIGYCSLFKRLARAVLRTEIRMFCHDSALVLQQEANLNELANHFAGLQALIPVVWLDAACLRASP